MVSLVMSCLCPACVRVGIVIQCLCPCFCPVQLHVRAHLCEEHRMHFKPHVGCMTFLGGTSLTHLGKYFLRYTRVRNSLLFHTFGGNPKNHELRPRPLCDHKEVQRSTGHYMETSCCVNLTLRGDCSLYQFMFVRIVIKKVQDMYDYLYLFSITGLFLWQVTKRGWFASSFHVHVRALVWQVLDKRWLPLTFHLYVRAVIWRVKRDAQVRCFMFKSRLCYCWLQKRDGQLRQSMPMSGLC